LSVENQVPVFHSKKGGEFMEAIVNAAMLLIIAIELALIYVRLGEK
jgi:hypothetical protein